MLPLDFLNASTVCLRRRSSRVEVPGCLIWRRRWRAILRRSPAPLRCTAPQGLCAPRSGRVPSHPPTCPNLVTLLQCARIVQRSHERTKGCSAGSPAQAWMGTDSCACWHLRAEIGQRARRACEPCRQQRRRGRPQALVAALAGLACRCVGCPANRAGLRCLNGVQRTPLCAKRAMFILLLTYLKCPPVS
jgi:hypothetical protein